MISTNEPELKNKLISLYDKSGIPVKYQTSSLAEDWSIIYSPLTKLTGLAKKKSELVLKFTQAYIDNLDNILSGGELRITFKDSIQTIDNLIIVGGKDSGKTFLLSIIATSAIRCGYSVMFISFCEYLDKFQTFDGRNENEDFFYDCLNADLLIFDNATDYGINNNKFFTAQLDRLMSNRLNKRKITICSLNGSENPIFGPIWNKFTRETFSLKLPEAAIENKSKRT